MLNYKGRRPRGSKWKRIMVITLIVLAAVAAAVFLFLRLPHFGRVPRGERLARIEASPNWRDGAFRNLYQVDYADAVNPDWEGGSKRPPAALPTQKTDLNSLDPADDVLVWFGHSSVYLQTAGTRILLDPVLSPYASPVPFANRAFDGTNLYTPQELPDIDLLLISHDHWDHLDYATMKALKDRVGAVICPLGVGAHLERWGFDMDKVYETDWYDTTIIGDLKVHTTPAQHFSGRDLRQGKTLWASYYIEGPEKRIFISGDGSYSPHFADIAARYGPVDFALMENGQYDAMWAGSHMMPEQTVAAIRDLGAAAVLPIHNSRFCICRHPWDDPMTRLAALSQGEDYELMTPMIGQALYYTRPGQSFPQWWAE